MKLLLYILLSNYLFGLCTQKETAMSDRYYLQASKEQTVISQLSLLDKALKSCYSPEIETTKLIIQAQNSQNIKEKIEFYNQALITISMFKDRELIIQEENKINEIISKLYRDTNHQELAEVVKSKIKEIDESSPKSFLWVIILFGGFLFGLFLIFLG